MEQSSPIANKMFDKKFSMMHIPTKHVQCPWKLLKSVDDEGNVSYNLVNLYEKGNETLLEEQFLEENPSLTKEKLAEINKQGLKNRRVHFEDVEKERQQRTEAKIKVQPKNNPPDEQASPMKQASHYKKESVKEKVTEGKVAEEKVAEEKVAEEKVAEEKLPEIPSSSTIDEIFPSNEKETNESESIIKSVHTACSVLQEISKYLQKNEHPSDLNLKIERNIKNIFKKYYQEIVNSHEHATEFVGYIQDDLRSSKIKGTSYFFNSFQSNMLVHTGKARTKLIENSRPLHFKKDYLTYLDNFTLFLYGPVRKTPLNGLQIDVTFHFFQNKGSIKYFSHTVENVKFNNESENKKSWALSTLTLPIDKIISNSGESEITMIPTVHVKNRSVHILSLDISLKLLLSYRLETDLQGDFLLQSE
jgi:hypothetical protein